MTNKLKNVLNKPNELISLNPKKNLSTSQRKAYNSFLKFAQNKIKFENYTGNTFQISCQDLHNQSNLSNKNYNYIYEDLKNLMSTVVEIIDKENPKRWEAFTLLSHIYRDNDYYHYELNQFILRALREQDFFTPLNIVMINGLSSQYSITFYELAIRYNKFKIPKMSIEEVRELTNTQNQYKAIKDFRKRVLDKACNEISEKTDIILSYKTEKKGRRIAFIDFEITPKNNMKPLEIPLDDFSLSQINDLIALMNNEKAKSDNNLLNKIKHYFQEKDFDYVKEKILITNAQKNFISSYSGFLISALSNDYKNDNLLKLEKFRQEKERIRKLQEEEERLLELEIKRDNQILSKAKEIFSEYEKQDKNLMSKAREYFKIKGQFLIPDDLLPPQYLEYVEKVLQIKIS